MVKITDDDLPTEIYLDHPDEYLQQIPEEKFFKIPLKPSEKDDYVHVTEFGLSATSGIEGNCTVFEDDKNMFIIDAGLSLTPTQYGEHRMPDYLSVFERAKKEGKEVHVFTTHNHVDHNMFYALMGRVGIDVEGVNFYGSPYVQHGTKMHHMMTRNPHYLWPKFNQDPDLNPNLDPGKSIKIGGWAITPVFIRHSIEARAFHITAPNGVKFMHTGDFRMVAGGKEDMPTEDYYKMIRNLGSNVDYVFYDNTHTAYDGAENDVQHFEKTYADIFKENEGRRMTVATLSSALPTIDTVVHEALKAGRTVIFHGWYAVQSAKCYKMAGHQYSPMENDLDEDGNPRVMDSEDSRCKDIPPENTVIITTGQYFSPKSKLMSLAMGVLGDEDPKSKKVYYIPKPCKTKPDQEAFMVMRGPYPSMQTEWRDMLNGIKAVTDQGYRMYLHGTNSAPIRKIREKFGEVYKKGQFKLIELSSGGHNKELGARLFFTLLQDGARQANRPQPVMIPRHTDYKGLKSAVDFAERNRQEIRVPIIGQKVAFGPNRLCFVAEEPEANPRIIVGKSITVSEKGELSSQPNRGFPNGVYMFDYYDWCPEEGKYEYAEPIITMDDVHMYLEEARSKEGHYPHTYKSWEALHKKAGLNGKLSDFMKMEYRPIPHITPKSDFNHAASERGEDAFDIKHIIWEPKHVKRRPTAKEKKKLDKQEKQGEKAQAKKKSPAKSNKQKTTGEQATEALQGKPVERRKIRPIIDPDGKITSIADRKTGALLTRNDLGDLVVEREGKRIVYVQNDGSANDNGEKSKESAPKKPAPQVA